MLRLNYGYGFLEGECRKAINAVGLEPSVGFLHDFSDYQTKQSLAYDLQEPFRWLVDLSVIQAFESGLLSCMISISQGTITATGLNSKLSSDLLIFCVSGSILA